MNSKEETLSRYATSLGFMVHVHVYRGASAMDPSAGEPSLHLALYPHECLTEIAKLWHAMPGALGLTMTSYDGGVASYWRHADYSRDRPSQRAKAKRAAA